MSAAAAIEDFAETSPRRFARLAGLLYLITIVAGIIAQGLIADRLVAPADAATTAGKIMAHESLYRMGFTIYLIEMSAQIAMTVLFYYLLKPVSRTGSMLAATFGLVGCTIKTFSRLFYFAPLLVLDGNAPYLSVFDANQRQALVLFLLELNDYGAGIALAFFGFDTLLKGYLFVKSTFFPRFLGVLSIIGGLGWLSFLSPALGLRLFAIVAAVGVIGAAATILWLLIVGVNEQRWKEQATLALASIYR